MLPGLGLLDGVASVLKMWRVLLIGSGLLGFTGTCGMDGEIALDR
jgi:hypothetical protein